MPEWMNVGGGRSTGLRIDGSEVVLPMDVIFADLPFPPPYCGHPWKYVVGPILSIIEAEATTGTVISKLFHHPPPPHSRGLWLKFKVKKTESFAKVNKVNE